jgi:small subunit ribosomal protein S17
MKKLKSGIVTSDVMDKTVVVMVKRRVQHPIYKKTIVKRKKFVAHDADNRCKVGDRVVICETRPLSKTKRWRVVEVLHDTN